MGLKQRDGIEGAPAAREGEWGGEAEIQSPSFLPYVTFFPGSKGWGI